MSETDTTTATPEATETPEVEDGQPAEETVDYRAKWEGQRKVARDLEAKLKQARDELAAREKFLPPEELERINREREAETQAREMFARKYVAAELRAAASGVLADPSDATVFINPADFVVGDDGDIDRDALAGAIQSLVTSKPHLAVRETPTPRVSGSADGGARDASRPRQWTREDLRTHTPQEIEDARVQGLLDDVLAGKA